LEDIGYVETPYTFMKNANQSQITFELRLLGIGKSDSHIQRRVWIQQWDNFRELLADHVFPLFLFYSYNQRVAARF